MHKIRDLLRLTYGEGLSRRQVSLSTGIPVTTISEHLGRPHAADGRGQEQTERKEENR